MAGTITHQWTGTVLTITSDSGTSSCDLKGAKGDDGARGAQGAPGSSVAEDSQKLGGVAAAQYALKNNVPAHNLLDNSDFTNPVNQRGATTATLGKYFIDRWSTEPYPSGPSITIDSNGLTLLPTTSSTAGIYQMLPDYENRKGKVHTFAICVDNVWKCVSFTMGNFGVGYLIHGLSFFSVDNRNILIRNNTSDTPVPITIQRVALYEGSYDANTLPAYVPKGKHVEMLNCGISLTPHNLLDNSDFRNPVNQRGITSQIGGGYGLDRWRADGSGTISIESTGVSLTNLSFRQPVPLKAGTYTLAFHLSNGTTLGYVFKFDGSSTLNAINSSWNETTGAYINYYKHSTGIVMVQIVVAEGYTIIVDWAALYEGSYDASTLPAYQPKGYAAELAECQRYYRPFINSAPAMSTAATAIEAEMPLEPPMRVVPTITINSVGPAYTPEGTKSVSGSYSATNTVNKAGYVFYTPSIGIGLPCVITGIDGYLSADL